MRLRLLCRANEASHEDALLFLVEALNSWRLEAPANPVCPLLIEQVCRFHTDVVRVRTLHLQMVKKVLIVSVLVHLYILRAVGIPDDIYILSK